MMRVAISLIALMLATGAAAETDAPQAVPLEPAPGATTAPDPTKVCRDRIHTVRQERGLPTLQRDTSPEKPLAFYAVDKRIDGCSVLVAHGNVNDVRPLPAPREHRLMPAR